MIFLNFGKASQVEHRFTTQLKGNILMRFYTTSRKKMTGTQNIWNYQHFKINNVTRHIGSRSMNN